MLAEQTCQPAAEAPAQRTCQTAVYRPHADVVEQGDSLWLRLDMPGVAKDGLEIHFEEGKLTIRGQAPARQPKETQYLLREFGVGNYERSFEVSDAIDADRITAEYQAGVLTLRLPKVEAVKPRKIEVKVN